MASVDVVDRPRDRSNRRKPFANLVKRLTNFKGHNDHPLLKKASGSVNPLKSRKNNQAGKNNPYPESGHVRPARQTSQPSLSTSSRPQTDTFSYASLPARGSQDNEEPGRNNRSGAPTLATNPDTIHSDAGHSKAATTTTGGRAVSSIDGAGASSTFSSPNHSDRSLTTTLTTIQSQGNVIQAGINGANGHNQQSQPNGTMFHQPFPGTASAIPRHLHGDTNSPSTYNSATANNISTDNASILTLASSSKQRRRRSMDTDASVRALAPSSVWGGSRESLPLSVLSSNIEAAAGSGAGPTRPGIFTAASTERASVYSASGLIGGGGAGAGAGINSPALASERNSYYAGTTKRERERADDAKSLRSLTNLPARELDVASIRSLAPSEARLGGHHRNNSLSGSIGNSPLASPALPRQASTAGRSSRRSSEWRALEPEPDEEEAGPGEGTPTEKKE